MKEQLTLKSKTSRISAVEFGVMGPQEMRRVSSLPINQKELYNPSDREPIPFGPLDKRLVRIQTGADVVAENDNYTFLCLILNNQGTSTKGGICAGCGLGLSDCPGHFGHISLELPVFHVGYFKAILTILQKICKVS